MDIFLPDLVYDCLQCGKGCRQGWRIPVGEAVRVGIEASQAAQAVARRGYTPVEAFGEGVALAHTDEGNCVFLQDDNLCGVHAELGFAAKPRQCRQFPYQPVKTPDGFYIGLSFLCTAVQKGHGRSLTVHRDEIEEAVKALLADLGDDGTLPRNVAIPVVAEGPTIDWEGYLQLEKLLLAKLEGSPSIIEALWEMTAAIAAEAEAAQREGREFSVERLAARGGAPWDDGAQQLVTLFEASLVGLVEAAEPGRRREVSEAYFVGMPVYSDRLGADLNTEAGRDWEGAPWLWPQMRRYLGHLVFRKFLVGSSLLARSAALVVLARLLPFYTGLAAEGQGRSAPLLEDYHAALDVVEGNLGTHAEGLGPLFMFFAEAVLDHVHGLEHSR